MVAAADVSAVIVTRGDIDLSPVLNSLPFSDVIVWDNSEREHDYQCYGRFAGIESARHDTIYVQDDDILVPIPALLRGYRPGTDAVFANKPPAEEWRFLGVGALFNRGLVNFDDYLSRYPFDSDFHRVADVVFAYSHPYRSEWYGYAELAWSRAENRMYKQGDHYLVRERARDRTLTLQGENIA